MISPKRRSVSYMLPEIEHATISLRTQLRLSYETYAWLRYLILAGLALLGVCLLVLPGSFPPRVFALLWQEAPLAGHLLVLHGAAAFFALLALLVQALTWLLIWGLYLHVCRMLIRSVWRLYHAQTILASGWLPSTSHTEKARSNERVPIPFHAPGRPPVYPTQAPSMPQGYPTHAPHSMALPQRPANAPQAQVNRPVLAQARSFAPASGGAPSMLLTRPTVEAPQPARQFAQPTMPLVRARTTVPIGGPATSALQADWPAIAPVSGTGVAWDVGLTRKGRPNEDSVLTLRGTCNFAERLLPFELHIIADGMGGHAHGRLASHLAIKGMLETVIPGLVGSQALESEQIVDVLIDGVHWANQVIYQYGKEHNAEMGTTITAVLLLDELAYIVNVGDSRTYMYRFNAGLHQITRDHSLVARLVETGAIAPDDIYTHPERNKVYRGLGDKTDVTVDWFILPVQVGDLLLLCSDGLWEMVRNPHITEILATYASTPALASNALLRAALQAGGKDNVSLLVVRVQPPNIISA